MISQIKLPEKVVHIHGAKRFIASVPLDNRLRTRICRPSKLVHHRGGGSWSWLVNRMVLSMDSPHGPLIIKVFRTSVVMRYAKSTQIRVRNNRLFELRLKPL
jgi:hypothetical protein